MSEKDLTSSADSRTVPAEDTAVQVPCPHFGICGGCRYLNLPYEEQLALKERGVREKLEAAVGSCAKYVGEEETAPYRDVSRWLAPITESPRVFAYRNKMEFSFGDAEKGGPLELGLHQKGSFYNIVTVDRCRIVDEDYRAILRLTRDYFREEGLPFYHKKTHEGYLRHLLIRKALHTGEILADLITSSQAPPEEGQILSGWRDLLLSAALKGTFAGILHTVNDSQADIIRDDGTTVLYGRSEFEETLLGLRFKVTPFSFFQTNSYGAETLYSMARSFLQGGQHYDTVYDLYCGTGTITQLMAPACRRIYGVEIVPEAVDAARENAVRNGVDNCVFYCGDVFDALDSIPEKPDLIILDPPRDGVHKKALQKILSYRVDSILYIACKPASFARDLPAFFGAGYRPVRAGLVDEFPWTDNVELVTLLSRTL